MLAAQASLPLSSKYPLRGPKRPRPPRLGVGPGPWRCRLRLVPAPHSPCNFCLLAVDKERQMLHASLPQSRCLGASQCRCSHVLHPFRGPGRPRLPRLGVGLGPWRQCLHLAPAFVAPRLCLAALPLSGRHCRPCGYGIVTIAHCNGDMTHVAMALSPPIAGVITLVTMALSPTPHWRWVACYCPCRESTLAHVAKAPWPTLLPFTFALARSSSADCLCHAGGVNCSGAHCIVAHNAIAPLPTLRWRHPVSHVAIVAEGLDAGHALGGPLH